MAGRGGDGRNPFGQPAKHRFVPGRHAEVFAAMSRDDPSRCRLVQAGRLAAAVVRNGGHGIFRRSRAASSCAIDSVVGCGTLPAFLTGDQPSVGARGLVSLALVPRSVQDPIPQWQGGQKWFIRFAPRRRKRVGTATCTLPRCFRKIVSSKRSEPQEQLGKVGSTRPRSPYGFFSPNASVQIILAATRWPDSSPGVWHKVSRRVRPRRSINRRYLDSLGPSATLRGSSEAPGRETLCDAVASTPERKRRRGHEFVCTCFACHGHVYPIATT